MFYHKNTAAILITALVLTACGGSGGGGNGGNNPGDAGSASSSSPNGSATLPTPNSPTTPNPPSTPVPTEPINTALLSATYPANSVQSAFYSALNQMRATSGLSYVNQNTDLDQAAIHHADYLGLNLTLAQSTMVDPLTGNLNGHSEDSGVPGYTGAIPTTRAATAGYTGTVFEVVVAAPSTAQTKQSASVLGLQLFNELMNTVYHRGSLMQDSLRDIGIGYALPEDLVVDMAYTGAASGLPSGGYVLFPADGAVDPYPYWSAGFELPNPTPSITSGSAIAGPISVVSATNSPITAITTFRLTDAVGNVVPALEMDASNDPNHLLLTNEAFLIPSTKLDLSTTYQATFVATVGGKPVNKTWSFTTPPGVISFAAPGPYVVHNGETLTIDYSSPSMITLISKGVAFPPGTNPSLSQSGYSFTVAFPANAVNKPQTFTVALQDSIYTSVTALVTITVEP